MMKILKHRVTALIGGLVTLLLVSACSTMPTDSREDGTSASVSGVLSLNGGWRFAPAAAAPQDPHLVDARTDGWRDINVPGNWYLAGHELAGAAFYKRQFEVGSLPADAIARIVFEAVDYAADVWVNGVWIGRHQGYFDQFSFPVTAHLKPGEVNDITVRVDSPKERPEDWSLNKRLIKGVLSHHDTRPGGAWSEDGQDANTGGIWGSVHLALSRSVSIDGVRWKDSIDVDHQRATTTATIELSDVAGRLDGLKVEVVEKHRGSGRERRVAKELSLSEGQLEFEVDLGHRAVELWQPWEFGDANIYDYDITVLRDAQRVARFQTSRGLRTVRRDAQSGQWYINDKRLFLRGTNYIPSQWLSEMSIERFRRDIDLMRQANINAVRVHALVLPQRFYDLANEAGILVWQDFPLQWGYSDDAVFHAEAQRQLERMIRQFGHHPSIFAWSMHNEPPWEASWMQYKYKDYDSNQNRDLDRKLTQVARSLDDTRHVHEASLTAEHPWFGWYSGSWKDYAKPTRETLITEFGAQALPSLDVLSGIFAAKQLTPGKLGISDTWRYHNFQKRETFEIAKIAPGENAVDLVNNTQTYQARLVKFAAESYRRTRYSPVAGIFQFMFVESWPSVNWGVLDYQRTPKPGYSAMRTAYQPVLPSIEFDHDRFAVGTPASLSVWVVNDLHVDYDGANLESSLWSSGRMIENKKTTLDVAADSSARVFDWSKSDLPTGEYVFRVRLAAGSGELLGVNQFNFVVGHDDGSSGTQ